jgi:hypothetical protein
VPVSDDAVDAADTIEMKTGAIAERDSTFTGQLVVAAGTAAGIGAGTMPAMPFEDRVPKSEPLGLGARTLTI